MLICLFCYTTFSHRVRVRVIACREYKHLCIQIKWMHIQYVHKCVCVFSVFKLRLFFFGSLLGSVWSVASLSFVPKYFWNKFIWLLYPCSRNSKRRKINYRTCYLCFVPKRTSICLVNGPAHTSTVWFSSFSQAYILQ